MTTFLTSFVTPGTAIYLVNLALASLLISFIGLLAAGLFRKQSAPLRHAILVLTVVFSLLAPGLTWCACHRGWGLIAISFAEPMPKEPSAKPLSPPTDKSPANDTLVITELDRQQPKAKMPAFPFALRPREKASREDTRAIDSAPTAPQEAAAIPKELPPKKLPASPSTAISWPLAAIALAAYAWLIGSLIGAVWVARGFFVLWRFRRSLEVSSLDRLEQASRKAAAVFGAERLPPVRVSASAPAPLTLGLLHPLIVLPKNLAETIDAEQLRAILVHEAAHLVHHHHWIGLAQWLAGILFWWNPFLHRVHRGILRLREEICDDHVLQSPVDGREFARLLVDLAARLTDLPRVPATLAILETGYADLQRRITNLLDKERAIVTRMTRKATFSVLFCGLIIALAVPYAGLRATQKNDSDKATETIESGKSKTPIQDADHSTKNRAGEKAPAAKTREIVGRVLDLSDKPIAGAEVGLQLLSLPTHGYPDSPFIAVAKADASGRFRLSVPEGINLVDTVGTVWAIAEGYQPKQQNACESMNDFIISGATLKLSPSRGTVVRIVDTKGGPVHGVRVTVHAQRTKEHADFPIPPEWRDRLSDVTGADGQARIANAIPDAITEVALQPRGPSASVRLDQSFFVNHHPAASASHFTWSLPETGALEGRLEVHGGKLPADLKVKIQTRSRLANDKYEQGVGTWGTATAAVDAQGRFKVIGIAAGTVFVLPFLDDKQPLRAIVQAPRDSLGTAMLDALGVDIPRETTVRAGKTSRLTISVRRGVVVHGLIRKQDTKNGYPDFMLDLCYAFGTCRLTTDKDGRFSAVVLPGPIQLYLLSHPDDYLSAEDWRDNDRFTVPDGKEPFDLGAFELVPADRISGKLVDLDNKPVNGGDWYVYGTPEIPGKDEGMPSINLECPDKDGRFSGNYPRPYPPKRWTVSHVRWPTPYQNVFDQFDAKILSRKPLVLQVPVHGHETKVH